MKIFVNDIAVWEVEKYTFNDPHMGVRSITMDLEHPAHCIDDTMVTPDFKDSYVVYNGDRYYISSAKPTGEKSNSNINYKYNIIFNGKEAELGNRKIRNLALVGIDTFISQGTRFSIYADLTVFGQLLQNNLDSYFDEEWNVVIVGSAPEVRLDIDNMTILELLQKTYDYYGVRWRVIGNTIHLGYASSTVPFIFDYGKTGGLAKISRTLPNDGVYNRVIGSGGTRNVPVNYFSNRHPDFPLDPDPISPDVYIPNLMPKAFRDSVIAKEKPYKDYAEDAALVAEQGVRETALSPNDDIYPSIAGVTKPVIGRIDQIIAYEELDERTFNIWVKDIGFDLADDKYTTTEEAKISFTSGMVAGYEFVILAYNGVREVVVDTSRTHNGVSSKYKITLIKSEEDAKIGRPYIPYDGLEPNAGDSFVIYDIEMPYEYVLNAEERLQGWLDNQLAELKVEKPSYVIEPYDSFLNGKDGILDELISGNKIVISNDILIPDTLELYISRVSVEYGRSIVPKYTIVVSDKVEVDGSSISKLSSKIDGIENRQYFSLQEIKELVDSLNLSEFRNEIRRNYLSKINPDTAQDFIEFLKGISVEELATFSNGLTSEGLATFLKGISVQELAELTQGLEIGDFQSGMHAGQGGLIDSAGNAELESMVLRSFLDVPTIRYNELEYIGEEIIIGAGAVLKDVEHLGDDRYRLTLKLEDGQFNPFRPSDLLKGIYNMDEEGNFTGFGTTYVSVSSIDEHEMIVILADESDVVGNSNMPPRKFMHLARIGNFIDTDRQSYISLSAKDRAITQYGGVNAFAKKNKQGKNVRAGVVTTQWGRAEGLEFIENFDNLPITKDSDVLYTDTLLYNKQIKVDYEGIVIKEYIDRGQWFEGMECQVTETTIDEVWFEAEKFRLIDRPIENDPFVTTEKPTRESEDWMLILSFKEEIDGSRGSVTFFAKPAKYKKGDRWILTEDIQLLNNYYLKGQILEAAYATNSDSDWRLMLIEGDEEATEGINLIRNYTFKEGAKHWGNIEGSIVGMDDEIPTDYYTPSINVLGDEYGYEYAITTENDELIILDE